MTADVLAACRRAAMRLKVEDDEDSASEVADIRAETDVCALSTVLSAVDLGFRVVIVEDALCSSSDVGHDAGGSRVMIRHSQPYSSPMPYSR
ncbi:hypothetical protein BDS110ZK25_27740 [Bradyrhizobium diazoefficiens]